MEKTEGKRPEGKVPVTVLFPIIKLPSSSEYIVPHHEGNDGPVNMLRMYVFSDHISCRLVIHLCLCQSINLSLFIPMYYVFYFLLRDRIYIYA